MAADSKISSTAARAEVTAAGDGVLAVHGVLSFDTVPGVYTQSAAWAQQTEGAITIDLKDVQRADSAGLALLVEWLRLARAKGRTLRFTNIPEQLKSLIRVNGLSQVLRVDQ